MLYKSQDKGEILAKIEVVKACDYLKAIKYTNSKRVY